jgi:glutathione peroxidase
LQKLYENYKDKGFEVLGFPSNQFLEQDPGTNAEIQNFCQINYGVDFTMFEKIDVRGESAHPIFKYLTSEATFKGFDLTSEKGKFLNSFLQDKFPEYLEGSGVKWNFTKFLIDKNGSVVSRYESPVEPEDIAKDIEKIL